MRDTKVESLNGYCVYRCVESMETYADVVTDCERREVSMDATLDTMRHPLDPPPPDVLLALLARNKALEGEMWAKPFFCIF